MASFGRSEDLATTYAREYPVRYKVNDDGTISSYPSPRVGTNDVRYYNEQAGNFPYTNIVQAQNAVSQKQQEKIKNLQDTYEKRLSDVTSQENTRNSLAAQIQALTTGSGYQNQSQSKKLSPVNFISATENGEINQLVKDATKNENGTSRVNALSPSTETPPKGAIQYLTSGGLGDIKQTLNPDYDPEVAKKWQDKQRSELYDRLSKYIGEDEAGKIKTKYDNIYSVSNLQVDQNIGNKLNFQVSDDQILNDYNASKISKLTQINENAQTQKAGIMSRLSTAEKLLSELPTSDARYKTSEVYVNQLKSDLASVDSAIADSFSQIRSFKPIALGSSEAAQQITSFREYLQLPEERATQQLRQIDPESYQTSVALGQQYRQMATTPIGETKSAQAEQLRSNLEQEAINQLALGSQLGAEEQRQYQQAARAAQTARGNIFGVAPAVEEAVTTGAAGEQRKLARYGAATQFLASGQNTSDALKSDIAFRDALLQNRLGAASGFIAGGPSIYNLSQARTAQQQNAMQNYVQANQALPGGFNQQPSTASNFYQTTDPSIPVALQNAFTSLYGSQANYLANTYGAQVGAISRQPSGAQNFATVAGGAFDLARGFGALGSAGLLCWVAREVYGIDNPKWLQFREWMLTKASDNLRNFYIEYGERIAESIRNKPKIKAIIRKWMDSKIG